MGCSQPKLSRTGLRNILAFLKVELQHFLGGTRALLPLPARRGLTKDGGVLEEKNVKRRVFLFEVPLELYLKMHRYLHIGRVRVPHRICTVRDNTPII